MKCIVYDLILTFVIVVSADGHDYLNLWKEPKEICDNTGKKYNDLCAFATTQKETCGSDNELYLSKCSTNATGETVERKDKQLQKLEEKLASAKEGTKKFKKLQKSIETRKAVLQKKIEEHKAASAEKKAKIEARRKEIAQNFKLCGIDSTGVNKTYDNMCLFSFEKACQKVKVVHPGACGDCSKENVCPSWGNFEAKTTETPRRKHKGRKGKESKGQKRASRVCDSNGVKYDDKCAFKVARCTAFQNDKSLPLLEWKKCTKD